MNDKYQPVLKYISETPELLSVLYDIDFLPEQLEEDSKDWCRMIMIAGAWKGYESKMKMEIERLEEALGELN